MWKYVSRRLRDTVERTCQQFDVTGIWPCEKFIRVQYKPAQPSKSGLDKARLGQCSFEQNGLNEKTEYFHSHNNNDYKHRMRYAKPCILKAIGISYALLFGWYCSQYIFLHRRKLALYCKYKSGNKHQFWTQCYLRHASAKSAEHGTQYEQNDQQVSRFRNNIEQKRQTKEAINFLSDLPKPIFLAYEPLQQINNKEPKQTEKIQTDLDVAVSKFVTTVAESAYQLALQSLHVQDYSTAINHLKTATYHNHAGAMFNLGICYENGLGIPKDMKMALQCYMAASSLGHAKAMYNLGVFYVKGLGGLKKNRKAAIHYFMKAANLGLPDAKDFIEFPQIADEPSVSVYDYVFKQNFILQPVALAI